MQFTLLLSLTLLVFITFFSICEAKPTCVPCDNPTECDKPPTEHCKFGEARDDCRRRVCAKGPGNRCGGPLSVLGVCGEGMWCHADERCHGCSIITMKCFPEPS